MDFISIHKGPHAATYVHGWQHVADVYIALGFTRMEKVDIQVVLEAAQDPMTKIIRGHYVVDKSLDQLLILVMPRADKLDVHRIAFLLKVDLLIAQGVLPNPARPVFGCLNAARNKFAHNPFHEFSLSEAIDVRNTISANFPQLCIGRWRTTEDPIDLLVWLVLCCHVMMERALEMVRHRLAEAEALNGLIDEMVPATVSKSPRIEAELERRIASILGGAANA